MLLFVLMQFFSYLFYQTWTGSRSAVLRKLGEFCGLDVVTRASPALISTRTPAAGRSTFRFCLSNFILTDFVWLALNASLIINVSSSQPQHFLHPRPAHPPRGQFRPDNAHQRVSLTYCHLLRCPQISVLVYFEHLYPYLSCLLKKKKRKRSVKTVSRAVSFVGWLCAIWLGLNAVKSSVMVRGWRRLTTSTPPS